MAEKPLPHSPEAERAVLGAILLDNAAFEQARVLGSADFFLPAHGTLWNATCALFAKSAPVDAVTLAEELSRREQLEGIGGPAYLSSLTDGLPKLSSAEHYVKIVRDKATLRRTIYAAKIIMTEAQREPENIGDFLRRAKESLPIPSADGKVGPIPLIALSAEELLSREIKPREMLLDPILPEQGLVMVYAKRGDGKTYIALGMAVAVAGGGTFLRWKATRPRRVLYVDGELPAMTLKERIAMIVAGADVEPGPEMLRLITPDLQERPMPDLATAEGQAAIEVHLDGIDLLILDNLSALCRYGKENEGESWLPVQGWALSLRRRGMAVVFVHHAGKSGTQRGTSRREDLLDTIITLKRSSDYSPEQGLRCEVHFEKTRAIIGDAAKPVEVQLETGSGGQAVWTTRDLEDIKERRAFELYDAGATVREVAEELGIGKSSAHRLRTKWDKSRDKGHAVPLSHSIAPGQRDRRANGGERVASQ